ncbi:hypothetical protein E8E14_011989 [Neopestalotiopsis sp. 37M]|nr:hypothetical protein E8E14_011989 [Neopestalotiopsis sp. 37M]
MYLLILAIPVIWTLVLTVYLLKNPRTLVRLLRWTLWTYLFVFSMLVSEVVREGLMVQQAADARIYYNKSGYSNAHKAIVNGPGNNNDASSHHHLGAASMYTARDDADMMGGHHQELVQDVGFWWFLWALLIVSGALTPWALAPAAALPAVLLGHPPFRALLNHGLARLGWTAAVYSPVLWAASHLVSLLWSSWRAVPGVVVTGHWASWIVDKVLTLATATTASASGGGGGGGGPVEY